MKTDQQTPEILVTGGNGLIGKVVCDLLVRQGLPFAIATHRQLYPADRQVYFDLASGRGIRKAVAGRKIIMHLASDKKNPNHDIRGTRTLLRALRDRHAPVHLIYLSIVGADQLPLTYFKQKWQSEQDIRASGIPYTILRATQVHEYIAQVLHLFLKWPVGILPGRIPVQPIAVSSVAEHLVRLSLEAPAGQTLNIGGSQILPLREAAEMWLKRQHKQKLIIPIPLWGKSGRNLISGALTCRENIAGSRNWEEWLSGEMVSD